MHSELFTVEDLDALPVPAVGLGSIVKVSKGRAGRVIASGGDLEPFWLVKVHTSGGCYEFLRVPRV